MRVAPTIYVHVIYGDNSYYDWLAYAPFRGKLNEGSASIAWIYHRVEFNLANFMIIVSLVMLYNHKIDITGSVSFTFDYYNFVQLQAAQTLPF